MTQATLILPAHFRPVTQDDLSKIKSLAHAMDTVANETGRVAKSIAYDLNIDEGQYSKMLSGQAGIKEDPFIRFIQSCGSYLPLFYLNHRCGFDPLTMRVRESELERQKREAEERANSLQAELDTIKKFLRETKSV